MLYLTINYLLFHYLYKLDILPKDNGYNIPSLTICTQNNILYGKQNLLNYFDLNLEYKNKKLAQEKNMKILLDKLTSPYYNQDEFIYFKNYTIKKLSRYLKIDKIYYLNKFFVDYQDKILTQFNYIEIEFLVIKAEELFKCSINNNSIFKIETLIVDNNEFGICYKFIFKNNIVINDKNLITIEVNSKIFKDFLVTGDYEKTKIDFENLGRWWAYMPLMMKFLNEDFNIYSNIHFRFYYFVDNPNRLQYPNRENVRMTDRIAIRSKLQFKMTSFEYLSTPYMENCDNNSKRNYILLYKS